MAGEAAIGYHTLRAERVNDVFVTLVVKNPTDCYTLYPMPGCVYTYSPLSLPAVVFFLFFFFFF